MPEKAVINDTLKRRFESGNVIGALARGLFDTYELVSSDNLISMIQMTKRHLQDEVEVICEAAFEYDELYCAVDILKKELNGYSIYEVKSSTDADKEVYIQDVAYQKYVLQKCGLIVVDTFLVSIDSDYILDSDINIKELFTITNIGESVEEQLAIVEQQVKEETVILSNSKLSPDVDLGLQCHKPYDCAFWNYCSKHLPQPSVFDLYRMNFSRKIDYYKKGVVSFTQLSKESLNERQTTQVSCFLNQSSIVNRQGIQDFLATLSYPLYFLDFETMQPVVPLYPGTSPYQQTPFQYSLHYIEIEGGELKHTEFLGVSGEDPRRSLAEQLCNDIPENVCVTAYNKAFECTRLTELANAFPDLSSHLLNIRDNIIDLLVPFQKGYYYVPAMGGSFSIKSVLPALYPDDESLNYHNLSGEVHNGSEAMDIFPRIKDMNPDEQKKARQSLLEYCKLDTFAMVKVWQKLCECI